MTELKRYTHRVRGLWGGPVPRSTDVPAKTMQARDAPPPDAQTRLVVPCEIAKGDEVHRWGLRWTVVASRRQGLWGQRIVLRREGRSELTLYLTQKQPLQLYPRTT